MARGVAYGVGVGSGDPEMLTLKAVRIIRTCPVIAVPGRSADESLAYQIAIAAVPEIAGKDVVALTSPMVRDRAQVEAAQASNARTIETYLDAGRDVACLVLGDPSIYSTFGYVAHVLAADGYEAQMVSGVSSFCAVAARLGISLVEWDEPLHLEPSSHDGLSELLSAPGAHVLMKAGSRMCEVKKLLREDGLDVLAVERCGLSGERVWRDVDQIPDDVDYLTLVIARR